MRPYYNYDDEHSGLGGMRVSFGSRLTNTVKVLLIANALAYLVELIAVRSHPRFLLWLAFYEPYFLKGAVWQVVTYMFIHDPTSLWHLLGNLLGLYMFGGDVERSLGRRNFLILYFLCGVAGALLSLASPGLVMGASGGVLGLLTAFAVLFPDARLILFPIPIPIRARTLAIAWGFITVASLLMSEESGVAHWAHLGGIAVGFLFVRGRPLWGNVRGLWKAKRRIFHERRSAAEQAELDRILEKVHREGITALSNAERDFLNMMSRKKRDGD